MGVSGWRGGGCGGFGGGRLSGKRTDGCERGGWCGLCMYVLSVTGACSEGWRGRGVNHRGLKYLVKRKR